VVSRSNTYYTVITLSTQLISENLQDKNINVSPRTHKRLQKAMMSDTT